MKEFVFSHTHKIYYITKSEKVNQYLKIISFQNQGTAAKQSQS